MRGATKDGMEYRLNRESHSCTSSVEIQGFQMRQRAYASIGRVDIPSSAQTETEIAICTSPSPRDLTVR